MRWTHLTISINIMMPQKPDNNSNLSRAYCVPGTVLSTLLVLTHWILMVSCSGYCYYHHFKGEQTDTENTHLSCPGSGRVGIWAQQSSPKVWTPNCYAVLSISNVPYRMTSHIISLFVGVCGGCLIWCHPRPSSLPTGRFPVSVAWTSCYTNPFPSPCSAIAD